MDFLQQETSRGPLASLEEGAGDHDQPYRFGWRPRASAPYPFNTRQYARLLVFRGRVQDYFAADDEADSTGLRRPPDAVRANIRVCVPREEATNG